MKTAVLETFHAYAYDFSLTYCLATNNYLYSLPCIDRLAHILELRYWTSLLGWVTSHFAIEPICRYLTFDPC